MLANRGVIAKEGDLVLAFKGYRSLQPIILKHGATHQCKEGKFLHDDIIGHPMNRYVEGYSNAKNDPTVPHLLILQPSSDLWTIAVPHRTQIIYDTDIAVIITNLRLGPGKVVVEAGTGSGSLTHNLARTIAPNGLVHTCDFHQGRCLDARGEFRQSGISHLVRSNWRDVCTTDLSVTEVDPDRDTVAEQQAPLQGFGLPAESVDAVFLDVPAPWLAIENVEHVLRPGGMLCTFSPCIEQTQRTVNRLREAPHHFLDVRTVEALTKSFSPVYKRPRDGKEQFKFRANLVSKGHSAYLTFARRRLPPAEGAEEEEVEAEEPEAEA
ncbi:tRNA (adenine-N1-)-methyltransferase catalytic subunit [Angomonas deanei]|uniref:tRNA (adenine(58)-N(1))-methyltransferase n=1 Tax=Angomonas deanei TaxID=59799 RepID=S9VC08_9TRYP|nr:tRNA (adenine-N1-)-methyltransferase catalytic subunit [Angomonas deanei]EPY38281.1 tRNA (adenine-N1-)-methyltransferase catalytic subunit [Angomonas deanei]EPY38519.1 tRNA (adenine-N1-)-methyltransferase catalytic subunit [Angomonas deanei]EPY41236.1 tRNA (adenine-N1-)-methyltransferase catalytic subunit [Angomonas deanei]CAD2218770.1 tRNA methyltransferase complex GCD14 subunit/Methyltransferase domain containing protein, putative [Angomonas deanei]|eukprot:EPY38077.1 tRNA (adenine-N1-)-methyltransferase catalytic subunit [Angomonas deanei]